MALLQLQCEGDSFLVATFVYAKFKPIERKQINQCRLYHQVITVADILAADQQYDSIDTSSHLTISLGEYQRYRWGEKYNSADSALSLETTNHNTTERDSQSRTPLSLSTTTPLGFISSHSMQEHDSKLECSASTETCFTNTSLFSDEEHRAPYTLPQSASDSSSYTILDSARHSKSFHSLALHEGENIDANSHIDYFHSRFSDHTNNGLSFTGMNKPEAARPFIMLQGEGDSRLHQPSEVQGMLAFLQDKAKGMTGKHLSLETLGIVPLPLSADTFGWMQQDSSAEDSIVDQGEVAGHDQCIPYCEQDDPPDSPISHRCLDYKLRSSITGCLPDQ